jgi:hypothetical protein
MTGTCATGPLHTLDMIERPFYISRTSRPVVSNRPAQPGPVSPSKAGDLNLAFSRALARVFSNVPTSHPLQQEVLAKRDLYESVGQSPDRATPAFPYGRPAGNPARRGTHMAFAPVRIGQQTLGGPLRAAGTQEDEE